METEKKCYSYHPETGIFTGETVAQKSPMEVDVYLLPANATFTPPLEPKDGQLVVYNTESEAWEYKSAPTPAEVAQIAKKQAETIARRERNRRLAATDYTQLADAPAALKAAYKPYRQALRDIEKLPGYPDAIQWPELPK